MTLVIQNKQFSLYITGTQPGFFKVGGSINSCREYGLATSGQNPDSESWFNRNPNFNSHTPTKSLLNSPWFSRGFWTKPPDLIPLTYICALYIWWYCENDYEATTYLIPDFLSNAGTMDIGCSAINAVVNCSTSIKLSSCQIEKGNLPSENI